MEASFYSKPPKCGEALPEQASLSAANRLSEPVCKNKFSDLSAVGRNQPGANREAHQSRHVANLQPVHDLRAMRLNGLDRELQVKGDFLGAAAFGDELEDFLLARRQRIE